MAIRINGDNTTAAPGITRGDDTDTGLQFGTDEVSIVTGGTEQVKVDSSGRLLVGTSSTPVSSTVVLEGRSGATNSEAILRLCRGQDTPADGATLGDLSFGDSNNGDAARIFAQRDGGTWTSASSRPSRLVFSIAADGASSPTERVRITSRGQFNAFSANNVSTLIGRNSGSAGTTVATFVGTHSATDTTNGTVSCLIWSNGNIVNTNNSYGSLSDIKLKENIVDASSQWDDLKAIQVRNYNFKEEIGQQTHTQLGVIAQEIELVSPGLVTESPDTDEEGNDLGTVTKSVNYSVLYMKAVKALQEAIERIETLEASNAALETRLTALEGGAL